MFENIDRFRHEHKYIEPDSNLYGIASRLDRLMKKDPHVTGKGYYSVRSLYFDDITNRYLNENIDGVDERQKWRIRVYDQNSDYICLERKIRKGDLVTKQSCVIDEHTLNDILAKKTDVSDNNPSLLNVFVVEMRTQALAPVVIVEYDRIPYVSAAGNTRITIDKNISSSPEFDALLADRRLKARPLMESRNHLIEVKYDAYLPDHIAHTIEHGRMRRETFSKYYLARKFPYKWRLI